MCLNIEMNQYRKHCLEILQYQDFDARNTSDISIGAKLTASKFLSDEVLMGEKELVVMGNMTLNNEIN